MCICCFGCNEKYLIALRLTIKVLFHEFLFLLVYIIMLKISLISSCISFNIFNSTNIFVLHYSHKQLNWEYYEYITLVFVCLLFDRVIHFILVDICDIFFLPFVRLFINYYVSFLRLNDGFATYKKNKIIYL